MKPKEKAEGESQRRSRRPDNKTRRRRGRRRRSPRRKAQEAEYLQQANQIYGLWWNTRTRIPIARRRTRRRGPRNPATGGRIRTYFYARVLRIMPTSRDVLRLFEARIPSSSISSKRRCASSFEHSYATKVDELIFIPHPLVPL